MYVSGASAIRLGMQEAREVTVTTVSSDVRMTGVSEVLGLGRTPPCGVLPYDRGKGSSWFRSAQNRARPSVIPIPAGLSRFAKPNPATPSTCRTCSTGSATCTIIGAWLSGHASTRDSPPEADRGGPDPARSRRREQRDHRSAPLLEPLELAGAGGRLRRAAPPNLPCHVPGQEGEHTLHRRGQDHSAPLGEEPAVEGRATGRPHKAHGRSRRAPDRPRTRGLIAPSTASPTWSAAPTRRDYRIRPARGQRCPMHTKQERIPQIQCHSSEYHAHWKRSTTGRKNLIHTHTFC